MPKKASPRSKARAPLSPERVLKRAIQLADRHGVDSLSMRKLAGSLGVEAMSLYNHVASKEHMLDGMVELVMADFYVPAADGPWTNELRRRALSVRDVLLGHPWAASLIESRRSGPVQMRAHEQTLACLRHAGFSVALAHRALLTIDSYLYGFVFQEIAWPYERAELPDVVGELLPQTPAAEYPHLVELMRYVSETSRGAARRDRAGAGAAYQAEFEFGLDLVLNALEAQREHGRRTPSQKRSR